MHGVFEGGHQALRVFSLLVEILLSVANLIATPALPDSVKQGMRSNSLLRAWATLLSGDESVADLDLPDKVCKAWSPIRSAASSLLGFLDGHGPHERLAFIHATGQFQ